ncbi:hypothetical protein FKM82_011747 [Ascaphus truei]
MCVKEHYGSASNAEMFGNAEHGVPSSSHVPVKGFQHHCAPRKTAGLTSVYIHFQRLRTFNPLTESGGIVAILETNEKSLHSGIEGFDVQGISQM